MMPPSHRQSLLLLLDGCSQGEIISSEPGNSPSDLINISYLRLIQFPPHGNMSLATALSASSLLYITTADCSVTRVPAGEPAPTVAGRSAQSGESQERRAPSTMLLPGLAVYITCPELVLAFTKSISGLSLFHIVC